MAGLVKSITNSGYLKIMLFFYVITLLFLGFQMFKLSRGVNISRISGMTFGRPWYSPDHVNHDSQQKTTGRTESLISSLKCLDQCQTHVISHCQTVEFPIKKLRAQIWQKVGPNNSTIVFSAYHQEQNGGRIQIMALSVRAAPRHFCQLWYTGSDSRTVLMNVSTANIAMLHPDSHKYISSSITCALPDSRVPIAVSVVTEANGCAFADNLLEIRTIPKQRNYTRNFTVCVSPLNFRYGRAYELVEWIELNRILGADHFIVYNYSSAVNVAAVLEYYRQIDIVNVVQWVLPVGVDRWPRTNDPIHVNYFAQTAALNDCLLRCQGESEYLVNIDLDEFIIPHSKSNTWMDLIRQLGPAGVYLFKNSFFRKEWSQETLNFPQKRDAERHRLVTLLKVEREAKIWAVKQRSKYIARTAAVEVIVTHDVSKLVPGQRLLTVPTDIGLLHHYRNWLKYDDKQQRVLDKTVVDKYAGVLVERVNSTWAKLKDVELDIPIE